MTKKHRQSLFFIIVTTAFASCISMIGGVGIELVQHDLLPLVPLIIALPALNTMVGEYATIIAAHAGSPRADILSRNKLVKAIAKSVLVNILGTVAFSLYLAHLRGYEIKYGFLITFISFVVVSITAVVSAMFTITYGLEKVLDKRKLNPDDILIPVVTSITDVFMLGLIALATKVLF
jgi:cation transporter-like permease